MLLTLMAVALSLLPPDLADGVVVFLTVAFTVVYSNSNFMEKKSVARDYMMALALSSALTFGNFFGVKSYIIAASFVLCDIHFLLELTGLRVKFRGIPGYGALFFIAAYTLAGVIYFRLFTHTSYTYLLFLSLVGGLSASMVEYIDVDKSIIVLLSSTVYLIFTIYAIHATIVYLAEAFALSLVLALISTKAGAVDESGLLSATLVGTVVIIFTDIRFFLILLAFHAIGSAATKYMYRVKYERGIAEPAGGARGYVNVFSNSLPALFFAINYGFYGIDAFKLAFVASIATALGDTMASEIGKTSEKVYLITNFRRVKPGTNGGVSLKGEIAAVVGCLLVPLLALAMGMITLPYVPVAFLASLVGVHIDSLLGATLEERGLLNNAGVNFLATLFGGLLCFLLSSGLSGVGRVGKMLYVGRVEVK